MGMQRYNDANGLFLLFLLAAKEFQNPALAKIIS